MSTMNDGAACMQRCAVSASVTWTVLALIFVALIALVVKAVYIGKRRNRPQARLTLPSAKTAQAVDKEAAETESRRQRRQALGDADFEKSIHVRETGEQIAAMATLSSEYRQATTRRRFLSRKIVSNTVAEVARRHNDLKITASFAGSTQEGIGDTLQPIQYLQASSKRTATGNVESGSLSYQYAKRPIFSSDMDIMIVPLAISVGPNGDLEYEHVQSKLPSFVKLKPTAGGTLGDLRHCLTDDGYLSAKAAKKLLQEALIDAKSTYCGPSVLVAVEEHGVAVEMKWAEPSVNGGFFETVLIADFTFALRIPDWPRCAAGWIERARNWPSRHLTAAVAAGGCHSIAFYRGSSDDECHWRLSFSRAELILFNALPPYARDMCIALKALFKSIIQPLCPSLSSYHLKTVVLWSVEQAPPSIFSSSDGAAVALMKALSLLKKSVADGLIEHYFVSGHNILPHLSLSEVKTVTDTILDAAFYADLHLTRLRTFEAKYFDAKDYLLVLCPGESHQPESVVQEVIQRQLNQILSAIPDLYEEVPISIPSKPVLMHLLTGKVVKLAPNEHDQEACLNEYKEIVTAVVQDNFEVAKRSRWRHHITANFTKALARALDKGIVYTTEHSLVNASRYAKKVKSLAIVRVWSIVVGMVLFCGAVGGIIATVHYCNCSDASSSSTEYSSTGSELNSNSNNDRTYNAYDLGVLAHISLVGVPKSGTNILSDVSYKLPSSYNARLPSIRG